jgi:lipoprotein signal peptidase
LVAYLGGNDFTFFAIFNVADMAISTGVDIQQKSSIRVRIKEEKRPIQILNRSFIFIMAGA